MPSNTTLEAAFAGSGKWTAEQLKLAFHFYCLTPFGKLHSRNPEIVQLAALIGRTPSALAMKLGNFASLDPSITGTGRKGLQGASAMDREIWTQFHADWDRLVVECAELMQYLTHRQVEVGIDSHLQITNVEEACEDYTGETRRTMIEYRVKQAFFRRAVLSSYSGKCCISGLSDERLLVASHIVPWSVDKSNRLNPSNGLCLSAIHDKAFDSGLFTISEEFRVVLSGELRRRQDDFVQKVFIPIEGEKIALPDRFAPSAGFLAHHQSSIFIGR